MRKKLISGSIQIGAILLLTTALVLFAGADPAEAISIFFYGIFGNINGFAEIFVRATPLIFLSLSVGIAFKTGFFNLGAEGQFYMGALAATATVFGTNALPGILRILLAGIAAFAGGGIWAIFPAWMKNRLGISETISTIMFNYIAIMIIGIIIRGPLRDPANSLPQTAVIPQEATLRLLLNPTRLHTGTILAIVTALLVWFFLYKTTMGLNLQIIGLNKRAALCNGLPVNKCLVISALLSGGLAGVAGMNEVLGVQHRLLEGISGGNGYTAVLVALLARNHPIGAMIVSVGLAAIQVGANTMQRHLGIPSSIVSIIIGFIVLMILCGDFLDIYRENKKETAVR